MSGLPHMWRRHLSGGPGGSRKSRGEHPYAHLAGMEGTEGMCRHLDTGRTVIHNPRTLLVQPMLQRHTPSTQSPGCSSEWLWFAPNIPSNSNLS